MKPAPFDYVRAGTVDEALGLLTEAGDDARILAGGQTLMPILNMRLAEPAILLDISGIGTLDYIRTHDGMLEVGATTTQSTLLDWPDLARRVPLLAKAMPWLGHFQTRNKGTVCGSLAFSDPSAELPLCLALLGGEIVLRSARGERVLSAADFQTGMLATARRSDEMIVAARFPLAGNGAGNGSRFAFKEFALRHGDFAIVAIAVKAEPGALHIGVGGVADRPAVRHWPALEGDALEDALNTLAWSLEASDDHHASARYRRELVRRLGKQTVLEARA